MRSPRPKTLFWQLVLGTVIVQTFCLLVFIWYVVVSQQHTVAQRTRQRIAAQLDRLAAACSMRLNHGDAAGLHEVLELSRVAPTIDIARLTDLSGNTLAVSDNGRDQALDADELKVLAAAARRRQFFTIRNGQEEAVTPILQDGRPAALLWLEPNHALPLTTLDTILRISVSYGAFALLANILPIFLIVRTMTRSLHRLLVATQGVIHRRDLSTGFPLPVTTGNEAGALTSSFNIMVQELEGQRSGLLETLALLDSMLENAPIGFGFVSRELFYVRLNRFLADMAHIPVEQCLGRRGSEMWPGDLAAQMERYFTEVFATGRAIRNVELSHGPAPAALPSLPGAGPSARTWLMHFYPVRTEEDEITSVGVIVVEITDRLRAEETLRKTEKLAATGQLAASIAHEINNPLESVTNLLYLLETHDSLDAAGLQFVTTAQAELARVSEITQQTLRFYRQTTQPAETGVAELLESVVTLYQPRLTAAVITVSRRYRGEPAIFGLAGELRQVFANLIGNALDAMSGGGRLLLRARRSCGRRDNAWIEGVRITIADTGTGMSPATISRVFEAFFTTKAVTGTGLGLWVSDEIIRKHAGVVSIRSREGAWSGTVFMLFFPDGGLSARDPAHNRLS